MSVFILHDPSSPFYSLFSLDFMGVVYWSV